jgi:hypothetical protein
MSMLKSGEEFTISVEELQKTRVDTVKKPRDIKNPSDNGCGLFTAI